MGKHLPKGSGKRTFRVHVKLGHPVPGWSRLVTEVLEQDDGSFLVTADRGPQGHKLFVMLRDSARVDTFDEVIST